MALRKIRLQGDEVLAKVSRPVEKMTPRIHDLIGDMLETMYDAMGVGLSTLPRTSKLWYLARSSLATACQVTL